MLVFPDWYVCLSVALDAEEDEWYNEQYLSYIAAGGDPKKFPKRRKRYTEQKQTGKDTHKVIMDALGVFRGPEKLAGRKGTVGEYARVRGLQKVYQMPDGTFTDEAGNKVEPSAGSVFIQSKRGQ